MQAELQELTDKFECASANADRLAAEKAAAQTEYTAQLAALQKKLDQDQDEMRTIVTKLIEEKKTVSHRTLALEKALALSAEQLETRDRELQEQKVTFDAVVYGSSTTQAEVRGKDQWPPSEVPLSLVPHPCCVKMYICLWVIHTTLPAAAQCAAGRPQSQGARARAATGTGDRSLPARGAPGRSMMLG